MLRHCLAHILITGVALVVAVYQKRVLFCEGGAGTLGLPRLKSKTFSAPNSAAMRAPSSNIALIAEFPSTYGIIDFAVMYYPFLISVVEDAGGLLLTSRQVSNVDCLRYDADIDDALDFILDRLLEFTAFALLREDGLDE